MADTLTAHPVTIEDHAFYRGADGELLARLYRPGGAGPFPAIVDIHGGAWTSGDRTQNESIAMALARSGILVCSLDFRMPPVKRYPDTLADINLGIRWLKANAAKFGVRADKIGGFGTSSGGHQILVAAMRPNDPRYSKLPRPEAATTDAGLAFVISGWGVLDPLLRYRLAKERGGQSFVKSHDAFWGNEAAMSEGAPPLMLERGERVALPPALVYQGTDDEWVPQDMTKRFAEAWRKAGGTMELLLLPEATHSFFRDDPHSANALKSVEAVKAFILAQARLP